MSPNFPIANEIISGLWLGSIDAANVSFLKPRKIDSVLTILGDQRYVKEFTSEINHEIIIMNDGDPYDPEDVERGLNFIDEMHSKRSNLLVHCMAGVSRSSSMVAGYLMKKYNWNPHKAIYFVAEKRQVVAPATDTYNSVINYVHGNNNQFLCQNCKKDWLYIAGYDLYYQQYASIKFCSCSEPNLSLKLSK
jgi:protein-tyrosine phosphatase